MDKIKRIEKIAKEEFQNFSSPFVKEIRIMGGCICLDMKDASFVQGYQDFAYEHGVFSRPFLNYIYAMVPYILSEAELRTILNTMKLWVKKLDQEDV